MRFHWLASIALASSAAILANSPPTFRHLAAHGQTARARNSTGLTVTLNPRFRPTAVHNFTKQEDNGYHFEVSLVSFVAPREAVSVVAERLVEKSALNYTHLTAARWPDAEFLSRAKGCAVLTPEQAAQMPEASGMSWLIEAGFVPSGAFAFEGDLLVAPDRRHEVSIELVAAVDSCADSKAIDAALDALRSQIAVDRQK